MNAEKCADTNNEPQIALLQIRSTPLGKGSSVLGYILLNHLIRCIMPILNRQLTNTDNGDDHYEALAERQAKAGKNYDTLRNYCSIPVASTVVVKREDGGLWIHGTCNR